MAAEKVLDRHETFLQTLEKRLQIQRYERRNKDKTPESKLPKSLLEVQAFSFRLIEPLQHARAYAKPSLTSITDDRDSRLLQVPSLSSNSPFSGASETQSLRTDQVIPRYGFFLHRAEMLTLHSPHMAPPAPLGRLCSHPASTSRMNLPLLRS